MELVNAFMGQVEAAVAADPLPGWTYLLTAACAVALYLVFGWRGPAAETFCLMIWSGHVHYLVAVATWIVFGIAWSVIRAIGHLWLLPLSKSHDPGWPAAVGRLAFGFSVIAFVVSILIPIIKGLAMAVFFGVFVLPFLVWACWDATR